MPAAPTALRSAAAALAVASAVWLTPASATADVRDNAHLFSPGAVSTADAAMRRMDQQYHKQLFVETVPSVPDDQKAALQRDGNDTYFHEMMAAHAKAAKANGVYVLICMDPHFIECGAGQSTKARHIFTTEDLTSLRGQIGPELTDKQYDAVLATTVDTVQRAYTANIPGAAAEAEPDNNFHRPASPVQASTPVRGNPAPSVPEPSAHHGIGSLGLGSLLCVGLAVIILFSLFKRVFSGGGNRPGGGGMFGGGGGNFGGGGNVGGGPNYPTGGPAYGQRPGYQNQGQAGGGMGRGFLGGLLGGAVGGIAADKFEHRNDPAGGGGGGGGASSGGTFGDTGGAGGGGFDSGPSDAGAGFDSGSSGGDFSGGGGDSGGGGGGDAGGSGSDSGGGF